jgi:DNA invertase Pin-like site-specific DNA recombinase
VFTDTGVSGKLASRPEWDRCLAYLRDGEDTLVAVKLDRFGRSVRHLHQVAEDLRRRDIGMACLDQPIDTSSASGKLFFTMLAAFAEFERDLISERTIDGLKATRKRGHGGGRPRVLKPYQVDHARTEIDGGKAVTEVAAELRVSRATLYRALDKTP